MAVIAAEGYATEAARMLFKRADKDKNYRLFVLHDADPVGYNIARTLREETKRMPGYSVEVVDLGLKLDEVKEVEIPENVKRLVKEREQSRKDKDFTKSDELRKKIDKLGFIVEDTNEGTVIKVKY